LTARDRAASPRGKREADSAPPGAGPWARSLRIFSLCVLAAAASSAGGALGCGPGASPPASAPSPGASASAPSASSKRAEAPAPSLPSCGESEHPPGQLADPIARVQVKGLRRAPLSKICSTLDSRAGMEFSEERLRGDIHHLWSLGIIDDATVSSEQSPSGRVVTFVLREVPLVRSWSVKGVKETDPKLVRDLLTEVGKPFEPAELYRNLLGLRAAYDAQGFRGTTARFKAERTDDDQVDVTIEVSERPLLLIKEIVFKGVSRARERELRKLIRSPGGQANVVGKRFDADNMDRSVLEMAAYYYDRGMVQAVVHNPSLVEDAAQRSLSVVIEVTEGPVFTVKPSGCVGDLAGSVQKCLDLLGVKSGAVFNRSKLVEGIGRIRAFQAEQKRGTQIEPITEIDPKKRVVSLRIGIGK
jgi:outer membrane protein insertion porin family